MELPKGGVAIGNLVPVGISSLKDTPKGIVALCRGKTFVPVKRYIYSGVFVYYIS